MGRISTDQSHQVISTLTANTDWSKVDFDVARLQDLVIRDPKGAGARFTEFLKNGCRLEYVVDDYLRETGEITIELPALKRPTEDELRKKYSWLRSIERDDSTETPITLTLATVLNPDEKSISGKEYERRLMSAQNRLLGYRHREWLLEHQDEFPALKPLLGKVYIDFPGIIVVNVDGDRLYPCALQNGVRWDDDWNWFDCGFFSLGRVAVSRK